MFALRKLCSNVSSFIFFFPLSFFSPLNVAFKEGEAGVLHPHQSDKYGRLLRYSISFLKS